jgi:hypothetical protein
VSSSETFHWFIRSRDGVSRTLARFLPMAVGAPLLKPLSLSIVSYILGTGPS